MYSLIKDKMFQELKRLPAFQSKYQSVVVFRFDPLADDTLTSHEFGVKTLNLFV